MPEDVDPATLQSELARLEAGMKEGQALKQSLVAKKSGLEGQVRGLGEAMDDATLTKALAELTAENEKRATKLEGLRKAQAGGPGAQLLLDKKQLEALVKEYTRLRKMWAERKVWANRQERKESGGP